jgi:hypothetical protein
LSTAAARPSRAARLISEHIAVAVSGWDAKETTFGNCIFDLQLTVAFTELRKHFGNDEVASLLGFA